MEVTKIYFRGLFWDRPKSLAWIISWDLFEVTLQNPLRAPPPFCVLGQPTEDPHPIWLKKPGLIAPLDNVHYRSLLEVGEP